MTIWQCACGGLPGLDESALGIGDDRPGCHVVCSGFGLLTRDDINSYQFREAIRDLERKKKLTLARLSFSKHFMACSNADEAYTEYRLDNCETLYADFFDHFRNVSGSRPAWLRFACDTRKQYRR